MDLGRYFSVRRRQRSRDTHDLNDQSIKSYLELLASPINEDARDALSNRQSDVEKMTIHTRGAGSSATIMLAGNGRTSSGNVVIYKPHHEASSIELFYDLFFVANLGKVEHCMAAQYTNQSQPTSQLCINTPTPNVSLLSRCLALLTNHSTCQLSETFYALVVHVAKHHVVRR
jgi:hypothetical protein